MGGREDQRTVNRERRDSRKASSSARSLRTSFSGERLMRIVRAFLAIGCYVFGLLISILFFFAVWSGKLEERGEGLFSYTQDSP